MEQTKSSFLTNLVGFYILCVLVFDDSPQLYIFSNAVFVVLVLMVLNQKNFTIQKTAFSVAVGVFFAWTVASLVWCTDASAVVGDIKKQILFIVLMFVISHLCYIDHDYTTIFKWFIVAGIAYFVSLMNTYGIQQFITSIIAGHRIGDDFLQLNKLAMNCALIFIISFNFLLEYKKKLYIVPMIMMLFLMIGAESRRAFLVLAISTVLSFLLFIKNERNTNKKLIYFLIGVCVLFISIYIYSTSTLFTGLNSRFNELTDSSNQDTLRMLYLQYGFDSFKEHPFLGLGSGNSHIVTLMVAGKKTYLHNNYMEMLVNLGLFGFAIYYYLYYYLIRRIRSAGNYYFETRVMLILLVAQLISDFGVTSYSYKFTYVVFALALGVIQKNAECEIIQN